MPFDIVTIEHSASPQVLLEPATVVTFPLSQEDHQVINNLKEALFELNALGVAAPQIGIAKRIIVYAISDEAKSIRSDANETIPFTVLINPSYTPSPNAKIISDWEGCLSVTEKSGKVPRYDKITYSAFTIEGEPTQGTAQGFTARVLQHEIDHINGVLISHRLTSDCIQGHPKEMFGIRMLELNDTQKEALKKMVAKSAEDYKKIDPARAQMFSEAKKLLDKKSS